MSARGFTRHLGIVAPMMRADIDTDAIIPSREMKRVSRSGLAVGLFAGWRYLPGSERTPDPKFVLNQPRYAGASVLATGPNFGCGSSREHAVWALVEFGIRALIAPSFGAIFERNCVNNGLLPIRLPEREIERLLQHTELEPQAQQLLIDLQAKQLSTGNGYRGMFEMAETQRSMLLLGQDPIDLTLEHQQIIAAFEQRDRRERPWVYRWRGPAGAA